jgi:hypothetical protein
METHDDDNGMEDDLRAVYGAHQEYDDEGNYLSSHYAMSAAMEPDQYGNCQQSHYVMSAATDYSQEHEEDGEQESENYAS